MIDLSNLPKIKDKGKKRLGRGKRDARGAKSGRGTKGSLKRGKMPLYFEGGTLPLIKRIPMLRGKGKNKPIKPKPCILNIDKLGVFRSGSILTLNRIIKQGLVDKYKVRKRGLKILGMGKLDKKLKISNIPVSKTAEEKIKRLGGVVIRNVNSKS